ncbi:uncharacterized protein BYT42DRAFT_506931 [Radiomyces spectabilis]|uniref:uncharacterized protein n=1 Tax=Radiomyces spectabilis TaxID=64574 RepID=UPI00221F5589|nr:uncharacterized protein BYT42DRAFT_506931 [Radiomyces spectabilis]KAI8393416.1 hypothetical protein BYT42DRAFT_506931 [Radiomyces spectabilis]
MLRSEGAPSALPPSDHSPEWLQPDVDTNANNSHKKKKSMERLSRLFQKKSKKKSINPSLLTSPDPPLSLSFSTMSLASQPEDTLLDTTLSRPQTRDSSICSHTMISEADTTQEPAVANGRQTPKRHESLKQSTILPPVPPQHGSSAGSLSRQSSIKQTFVSSTYLQTSSSAASLHRNPSLRSNAGSTYDYRASQYTSQEHQQQHQQQPQDQSQQQQQPMRPEGTSIAALKARLSRQRQHLEAYRLEKKQYQEDIKSLTERLEKTREKTEKRTQDMKILQKNYTDHIRSMRATHDDLDSIVDKLHQLQNLISELAGQLLEHADPNVTPKALQTFWLNLHDAIDRLAVAGPDGNQLSPPRIKMLTEKFMMDVLVQNLNSNVFPGLQVVDAYNQLQSWFETHDPAFSIRLRQEMALVVVAHSTSDNDVHKLLHNAVQNNWKYLYGGLVKAYPFIYQHDKSEPVIRKHYGAKVQVLVEQALALGFAIKSQEVDITAADIREGIQQFDPESMIDIDDQTSGTIEFCISPPFAVIHPAYRSLVKGRVLCSPHAKH